MNFSSPDDMFTHSETQVNIEITLSQFVIYLNW